MNSLTSRIVVLFSLLVMGGAAHAQQAGEPGRFDYYLLALSWSPTWCESRQDAAQCRRRFGFVVHGLWPQYGQGGYPVECAVPAPLPEELVADMLPIMPSRALIGHQWRKHGTCQGGNAADYFATIRAARDRLRIPGQFEAPEVPLRMSVAEIEQLFVEINPGLSPQGVAVICRGGKAAEIRVCLDRDLEFRQCGGDVRDRCKGDALFPAAR